EIKGAHVRIAKVEAAASGREHQILAGPVTPEAESQADRWLPAEDRDVRSIRGLNDHHRRRGVETCLDHPAAFEGLGGAGTAAVVVRQQGQAPAWLRRNCR